MISVIVPTMWVHEPFLNFIGNITQLNCIGEIVIINNCVQDTPNHDSLKHSKIKMHNMHRNIFVNPAWNLGASLSQYENLCFLSDDVMVDLKVFLEADKFLSKEIGVLGFGYHPSLMNFQRYGIIPDNLDVFKVTGDIKILEERWNGITEMDGNGGLFFIHKDNYVPIPEDFLISGGDVWTFECQRILGRKNYYINKCFFYSHWGVTTNSKKVDTSYGDFTKENRENYLQHIEQFKSKIR